MKPARDSLLVLILLLAGCRLSDPVFVFQPIKASEPAFDDRALVFGSIDMDVWGSGDPDVLVLVRRGPGHAFTVWQAERTKLFRVFRKREVKDGHFILQVPPGSYELVSIITSGAGQGQVWQLAMAPADLPRIVVTRPGVYDFGTLRVRRAQEGLKFTAEQVHQSTPERDRILQEAIAGTSWMAFR